MQASEKPAPLENAIKDEISKMSRLKVDGEVLLHMRLTQSLFKGSWKHSAMGLVQFARMMTLLSRAVMQDDPYAEWYLLKTYQALFDAKQALKSMELKLNNYFESLRGITVTLITNDQALRFPLRFSTPFGFMGAYLLADVDYVLRQLATLKRIGLSLQQIVTAQALVIHVQRVFTAPRHWHPTGVTRQDVYDETETYKKAKELMGNVPDPVLKKEIEFAWMPKKKERKEMKEIVTGAIKKEKE